MFKKRLFPIAVFLSLLPVSFVEAGEQEFAALFVRAHHDYADHGADRAIATLDQALKVADNQASKDLANTFLFAILKSEGRTYSDSIMLAEDGVKLLTRAKAMRPTDPFVLMHLGKSYCTLGQFKICERILTDAINVAKGEEKATYHTARGNSYFLHMGRPDLDLIDYQKAREIYRRYGNTQMQKLMDERIKVKMDAIKARGLL